MLSLVGRARRTFQSVAFANCFRGLAMGAEIAERATHSREEGFTPDGGC